MSSWQERHDDAAGHVVPFLDRVVGLEGARVLEFGAGNGPISCALAPHVGSILGLDIAADYVREGRRIVAERGFDNIDLRADRFEGLVEIAHDAAGAIDVFLLFAVLEHMTLDERLSVLATAKDVLAPGGSLCVFETPNRLLWWDHHTSQLPFFGMLEEPLALAYAGRSERSEFAAELRDAGTSAGLALTRQGRGASQHEFELALGSLDGLIVAGGYEPELLPVRHVHRDELYLARFSAGLPEPPSPVFSRYWLDIVLRFDGAPIGPLVTPWPFATDSSHDVAVTPWETLLLRSEEAWIDVPTQGAAELHLGVEASGNGLTVFVQEPYDEPRPLEVPRGSATEYLQVPLNGRPQSVRLNGPAGTQLSFVAMRGA